MTENNRMIWILKDVYASFDYTEETILFASEDEQKIIKFKEELETKNKMYYEQYNVKDKELTSKKDALYHELKINKIDIEEYTRKNQRLNEEFNAYKYQLMVDCELDHKTLLYSNGEECYYAIDSVELI